MLYLSTITLGSFLFSQIFNVLTSYGGVRIFFSPALGALKKGVGRAQVGGCLVFCVGLPSQGGSRSSGV